MSENPGSGQPGGDAWTLGDATRTFARTEADASEPIETFATVVPHEPKVEAETAADAPEPVSVLDGDGPAEVTAVSKLLGRFKLRKADDKPTVTNDPKPFVKTDEAKADEVKVDETESAETADVAPAIETPAQRADSALDNTLAMPAANLDGSTSMSTTAAAGATVAGATVADATETAIIADAGTRAAAAAPAGAPRSGLRPTRKARLRISRIDPWSVMKTSLLFSIAFSIIGFVAVWVLWAIISASGAIEALQEAVTALVGNPDGSGTFEISRYIDQGRVLGFTAVVSVINVVLLTAIATLISFLYNLAATVLGGLEVTLAED